MNWITPHTTYKSSWSGINQNLSSVPEQRPYLPLPSDFPLTQNPPVTSGSSFSHLTLLITFLAQRHLWELGVMVPPHFRQHQFSCGPRDFLVSKSWTRETLELTAVFISLCRAFWAAWMITPTEKVPPTVWALSELAALSPGDSVPPSVPLVSGGLTTQRKSPSSLHFLF